MGSHGMQIAPESSAHSRSRLLGVTFRSRPLSGGIASSSSDLAAEFDSTLNFLDLDLTQTDPNRGAVVDGSSGRGRGGRGGRGDRSHK